MNEIKTLERINLLIDDVINSLSKKKPDVESALENLYGMQYQVEDLLESLDDGGFLRNYYGDEESE